jgi:hypothetical protein
MEQGSIYPEMRGVFPEFDIRIAGKEGRIDGVGKIGVESALRSIAKAQDSVVDPKDFERQSIFAAKVECVIAAGEACQGSWRAVAKNVGRAVQTPSALAARS